MRPRRSRRKPESPTEAMENIRQPDDLPSNRLGVPASLPACSAPGRLAGRDAGAPRQGASTGRAVPSCRSWITVLTFLPLIAGAGTNKTAQLPPSERPVAWAAPLEKPGLPNLHRVTPTLFRGAQPSHKGMLQLEQM